jgi:hypothetical protein
MRQTNMDGSIRYSSLTNTDVLLGASKEVGLEVNTEKTKYLYARVFLDMDI